VRIRAARLKEGCVGDLPLARAGRPEKHNGVARGEPNTSLDGYLDGCHRPSAGGRAHAILSPLVCWSCRRRRAARAVTACSIRTCTRCCAARRPSASGHLVNPVLRTLPAAWSSWWGCSTKTCAPPRDATARCRWSSRRCAERPAARSPAASTQTSDTNPEGASSPRLPRASRLQLGCSSGRDFATRGRLLAALGGGGSARCGAVRSGAERSGAELPWRLLRWGTADA